METIAPMEKEKEIDIVIDSMLDGIIENTLYSYQVIVSNAVGNVSSKFKNCCKFTCKF